MNQSPLRSIDIAIQDGWSNWKRRGYRRRGVRTKAMTPLSSSTSDISPSSSSYAVATPTEVRTTFLAPPPEAANPCILSPSDSASVCTTLDSASLSSASVSPSVLQEWLCQRRVSSASSCVVSSKGASFESPGEGGDDGRGEGGSNWAAGRFDDRFCVVRLTAAGGGGWGL
jgi:hypothetical protein